MKKISFLLMLLSLSFIINAQSTSVITGRILDDDKLPLPGANINIEALEIGTVSDVNGFYTLVQVPVGKQIITVSYIGYGSETKEVEIKVSENSEVNFKLTPGLLLNEVEIGYQLQGQAKALNQQKSNDNVTNIVASDQVGKFPDANIGDAIKRIPGINVQYDQGEARFGHVRGTEPRLNSVTINGDRMPSAEGDIRAVQLDLIPSDMIQTIEVTKTLSSDMDADAIGGSINLVTRSAPSSTRFSATLGSGYNIISNKPTLTASAIVATRFAKDKLGVVFSGSYYDNPLGSDNIEAEWEMDDNGNVYTTDFQVRQYEVQRIRKSASLAFDYKINEKHTITLSGIYNHRNDWENRFRRRYKDIEYNEEDGKWYTEISRQTKGGSNDNKSARLEDQRTMTGKLKGEHLLGNIKLDWSTSYAKASEERPNERYISYNAEDVEVIPNFTDPNKPSFMVDPEYADFNANYGLKELTEENQYTDEIDLKAKLNLEIPLMTGDFENRIKVGAKYRGKEKQRDNNFYEYEPLDEDSFNALAQQNLIDKTKDNFLAGDYQAGHFVDNEFLGNQNLGNLDYFDKSKVNEELAGNYNATEDITSAYIMLKQNLGRKLKATVGLRIENTSLESQGYSYDADEDELTQTPKATDSYTNVLPNLQLKYFLDDNQIIRFAYTSTLARPNYYDLVPYREVYMEDNEIKIGNPSLNPTTSNNLDLMYENYFKSIGLLSGGLFYKSISDFIIETELRDYEFEGHTWDKYSNTVNGGDATIFGAEIAFQRQLDFLPGALKGIGVYANYTYIYSEVKNFEIEGREDEKLSLPGTPENNLNASISWEHKGFSIRVSANWASAFRDSEGIGETEFYDKWYDQVFYLDINSYYAFAKHWKIFIDASNLTNQPLRYYQGHVDRMMQAEYYNTRITAGIKFDMFLDNE
ncbi:TonB-dependent receptor [Lentimicrobium sp. L6]|uniref:TonB-dependent receptor n=1 Tax=Lentimicrobium sp. L6 TaxID=2735916 RepID=UPI001554976C|nr:TonB-dependent receptor [Lentimicrobium sp. L6]NPD86078.1 TonB-dependent receptor [Lentimicrobium sp. L6]